MIVLRSSIRMLNTFGTLPIVLAIVARILTTRRTNLFVDTTNRIDLALGAEIIDYLFRLPLKSFEKRPVGELATRINEIENIRQFLTGTALTVVLDVIFSTVYIELIAFRIIAGCTTQPSLRLVQLCQNFQETALSHERLSDILDTPQEVDENNITMPLIESFNIRQCSLLLTI